MALLATLLLLLGFITVWRLGKLSLSRERLAAPLALTCLGFTLAWLYFFQFTAFGLDHIRWDDFVFFERLPAFLPILLILALCWQRPSRNLGRPVIGLLITIFAGYALLEVSGPMFTGLYMRGLDDTAPRVGQAPEVIQSTGWTCSPAALAWALQAKGLPVSEKRVAGLTATTPFHGTPARGELRAAHRLGVPAYIRRGLEWEELASLPLPAVITWRLSGVVMHSVALLSLSPEGVTLGDPMLGRSEYTREEFAARWMHDALVLP